MGSQDWYRKTTWTEADRADFFECYKRARSDSSKAQYLTIQALCLRKTLDPALRLAAMELLEQCIRDFSDSPMDMQSAWHGVAQCHILDGKIDDAIMALLKALDALESEPNFITHAYQDFALLVIKYDRRQLFERAESCLKRFGTTSPFPLDR